VSDIPNRPKSTSPERKRRVAPSEIEASRNRLFEIGSQFKPVERDNIVGIENVLVEIDRIIHWLRHSEEYREYDSRLEPGIILEGEPGVGKTLTSRYIATASGATFVNVRDFEHEEATFKDSDIADLFNRARTKYEETREPVVLFWDEFEGAATDRADAMNPAQVATVSQITAELDGVHGKNEGLLLIGCTNYMEGIDPALRRAGRMGLHIEFHPPDRTGKMLILKHYLKDYNVEGDLDIETLSYFFDKQSTAADIEEACVEAWRYAVERSIREDRNSPPILAQQDLMQVFIKRLVGPPTSFINLVGDDAHRLAVHEAGHAIMACVFNVPLRLITVAPGKKSLGRVMIDDIREHIGTHSEIMGMMRVYAGSMAAEKAAGLEPITGSKDDLFMINRAASQLVDIEYAGKRTGAYIPRIAGTHRSDHDHAVNPNISQYIIEAADRDIQDMIDGVIEDAEKTMENIGSENLHDIADIVTEHTTMTGKEFKVALAETLGTDEFPEFRPMTQ
jgi:cell division protease FtsH